VFKVLSDKRLMNRGATLQLIKERQRQWAKARGIAVSANDRVLRLEDNLFAPLNIETRAEIEEGDGESLEIPTMLGKFIRFSLPLLSYATSSIIGGDVRFHR
jgi:hypothetical protein